jgi:uncharacterized protein YndB with AHSA1/START domain
MADRFGQLEQLEDGSSRLRFTRELSHPIERVWLAVTEPEHLVKWFPTTIEGERTVGAPLRFSFASEQFPAFEGELLAYDPPHVWELRWGSDVIRIELTESASGTKLMLFDKLEELGKAARDGAGWHTCLDALDHSLKGDDSAREQINRWSEVHSVYVERFGPEAATVGPPEGLDATAA